MVPLRGKMGTGYDTAYAALFLASDEAQFITGEILRVDGGMGLGGVESGAGALHQEAFSAACRARSSSLGRMSFERL